MASPGQQMVDRTVPGHGDGREPEAGQGSLPLGRLDGDAVGATESEGEKGGGRDGVTVEGGRTPAPGPERTAAGRSGYRRPVPDATARPRPTRPPASSPELLVGRQGAVLTLTINRPERRNAMTWDVIAGLRTEVARAKADPDGAGGGADRRRRRGLLRRGRPLGHGPGGQAGARTTSTPTTTRPGAGWPSCSRSSGSWASPPSPGSRAGPWPAGSGWPWPATW